MLRSSCKWICKKILEYRNAPQPLLSTGRHHCNGAVPGYAKVVKAVTEDDLNPVDVAHGGLFFSMADNAAGSAMAAYGEQAVTLNAQYNFMRAAKAGDVLTAEAREAKHGGTVCVFDIRITDQDGNLDGTGTFTFYNLKKPLNKKKKKKVCPEIGTDLLFGLLFEAILQADAAVEHRMARLGILVIQAEVAQTHELVAGSRLSALVAFGVAVRGGGQTGLHLAVRQDLQRAGIQALDEVLVGGVGVGVGEQVVVKPHLGVHGGGGVHPVDGGTLHLPAVGGVAAPAVGIILAAIPVTLPFSSVSYDALDEICTLQAALRAVGVRRLYLGTGSAMKSSASIHRLRRRVLPGPGRGVSGLFSTVTVSVLPAG